MNLFSVLKSLDELLYEVMSWLVFFPMTLWRIVRHPLEIALIGQNGLIANKHGLAGLISNDTNLIALRIVLFSLFALAMSVRLVRALGQPLDRDTLKAPFYSQCYAAGLFALGTGLATLMISQKDMTTLLAGLALQLLVLGWYAVLQTLWFSRHLNVGKLRAFGQASWAMAEAVIASIVIAYLFA